MDKFEEMREKMKDVPDEERMKMMEEKGKMCVCPSCPSYNECTKGKEELLYCAKGKSSCEIEEKGCTCPGCPITEQMGLKNTFFCTKGTEAEQRGM